MPSRRNTGALVGVVDRRQLDVLALDVAPDVQLGPVGDREHPDVLAGGVPAVVEVPQLGALRCAGPSGRTRRAGEKIRSLARARSSSRRPPPNTASNRCSAIVSSSGDGLQRVAGAVRALDEPAVVDPVLDVRDLQPQARGARPGGRGSRSPPGSCARCRRAAAGTARGAGANALTARCTSSVESLPPENRITGRSNSPATSRKMWIASDLQRVEGVEAWRRSLRHACSPHSVLASARPAAAARVGARQRLGRARRAADRRVALVDQRVDQDVVARRCRPACPRRSTRRSG